MSFFNIEVEGGTSVRLPTAGKYCDRDIVITATGSDSDSAIQPLETKLKSVLDGTLTDLEKKPTVTKIKPYAFYVPQRISDGYTEVEYISSTSDLDFKLDTGIFMDGVIDAELVAQGNVVPSNSHIVFSVGTGGNAGTWFGSSTNQWMFGSATEASTTIPYTTKITAYIKAWRDANHHIEATVVGGGKTETIIRNGTGAASYSDVTLFGTASQGAIITKEGLYGANAKIFSCKIWLDGVLKAWFVPCRNAEGIYGLYDTVRQTFMTVNDKLTGGSAVTPTPSETGVLESVDTDATEIGAFAFYNNDLTSLILRANQVVEIGENALAYTPIADGTGYIYVPAALVDTYKAAERWSTYEDQIRAIEDYPDITGG